MPTPAELQAMLELRAEVSELSKENSALREALKKIKSIIERESEVLIVFDIEDDRAGKSVRLYNMNGKALGFGDLKVNDSRSNNEQQDIFSNTALITYKATITTKLLFGDK